MESIQLTLSAEDIEIFRKSLDLFDKFAKNLEFVQYDGTKKIFKTHFEVVFKILCQHQISPKILS